MPLAHLSIKVPITRPKRCLRDICLPNPQLMVTSAKVYLGVDSRSSQPILDRNPVQLSVVNAQSKGIVLLLRK